MQRNERVPRAAISHRVNEEGINLNNSLGEERESLDRDLPTR